MKKTTFLYLLIIFTFFFVKSTEVFAQSGPTYGTQFVNNGFENWADWNNEAKRPEPLNWHGLKSASGNYGQSGSVVPDGIISSSTNLRPGSNGSKSALLTTKIYSALFGLIKVPVVATLTNGRMNASNMTVDNPENFIGTITTNSVFCTPIEAKPDSITIWVSSWAKTATNKAYIHCAVHGNSDFKLLADGNYDPEEDLVAKGDSIFPRTCSSSSHSSLTWVRMSVPFVVDDDCESNNPKYVLASFSVSSNPKSTEENDFLYIDDVLLVYNPTITVPALATTIYTRPVGGGTLPISIPYTIKGTMSPYNLNAAPNKVFAEMSDENGNWDNPTLLNTPITTDISGTIAGTIPANLPNGTGYKIRVITTNYADTTYCSSTVTLKTKYTLEVSATTGGTIIGGGTYDNGTSVTVRANANEGYSFIDWTENGEYVSDLAVYNFPLIKNTSLVANFDQVVTYTITAEANPSEGGTISGGGSYQQGNNVTLIAVANEGYRFDNWTEDGEIKATTAAFPTFQATTNRTLTANFVQCHTVNISAYPTDAGTFGGSGTYDHGASVIISAIPNTGYGFQNWTENGTVVSTNSSYEFNIEANRTFRANFVQRFQLSLTANPEDGGTVSGANTYNSGESVTAIATPNQGYRFVNWKNASNAIVSSSATYTFTITQNTSLTATFELIPVYTIAASAVPAAGGSITGAGDYDEDENVALIATANEGYEFVNWTEDGTQVSDNAQYSFSATGDRTLVANFTTAVDGYTITLIAAPQNGGIVTGGGIFEENSERTINAQANANYEFVNWTENGVEVSTNASYTFTLTEDKEFTANFNYITPYFDVVLTANPTDGGEVSGAGNFAEGTSITVTATPNADYEFVNWTENGSQVSTNANYTFTVNGDRSLVSNFTRTYSIELVANPANGGTLYGANDYNYGDLVTVMAIANDGYTFLNWTEDGNVVSSNYSFSFTCESNRVLTANFSNELLYRITLSSNLPEVGIISGAGLYQPGEDATVVAVANENYAFMGWEEDGVIVSTETHYTFTVENNRDLVANFEAGEYYQVTVVVNNYSGGTIFGAGVYEIGSEVTLYAVPNTNVSFGGWYRNGELISTETEITFVVNEDMIIIALFNPMSIKDYIVEGLDIYPNPASDYITVNSEYEIEKVDILSLTGKVVKSVNVKSSTTKIELIDVPSGNYILRLKIEGENINKKIIITK